MPLDRDQLAKRAAQELRDGYTVNLGIGSAQNTGGAPVVAARIPTQTCNSVHSTIVRRRFTRRRLRPASVLMVHSPSRSIRRNQVEHLIAIFRQFSRTDALDGP